MASRKNSSRRQRSVRRTNVSAGTSTRPSRRPRNVPSRQLSSEVSTAPFREVDINSSSESNQELCDPPATPSCAFDKEPSEDQSDSGSVSRKSKRKSPTKMQEGPAKRWTICDNYVVLALRDAGFEHKTIGDYLEPRRTSLAVRIRYHQMKEATRRDLRADMTDGWLLQLYERFTFHSEAARANSEFQARRVELQAREDARRNKVVPSVENAPAQGVVWQSQEGRSGSTSSTSSSSAQITSTPATTPPTLQQPDPSISQAQTSSRQLPVLDSGSYRPQQHYEQLQTSVRSTLPGISSICDHPRSDPGLSGSLPDRPALPQAYHSPQQQLQRPQRTSGLPLHASVVMQTDPPQQQQEQQEHHQHGKVNADGDVNMGLFRPINGYQPGYGAKN